MKAMMVNSTSSGKVVDNKMRDQVYLRHLRQVQKINNREAEQVTRDVRSYHSINEPHQKHKAYAFSWHQKQDNEVISKKNVRLDKKIKEIKSYISSQQGLAGLKKSVPLTSRIEEEDHKSPQQSARSKQKNGYSLHYRYRQRQQEEIQRSNKKLLKSINNQKSTYLPQIIRKRIQRSALGDRSSMSKSRTSVSHEQE